MSSLRDSLTSSTKAVTTPEPPVTMPETNGIETMIEADWVCNRNGPGWVHGRETEAIHYRVQLYVEVAIRNVLRVCAARRSNVESGSGIGHRP